jgi:hypothetical protein
MGGRVQAGVEDDGFVVAFIGQLEEGSVGVDCVPEVGPQGKMTGSQDNILFR